MVAGSARAFTLIGLLVVIAIIAIMPPCCAPQRQTPAARGISTTEAGEARHAPLTTTAANTVENDQLRAPNRQTKAKRPTPVLRRFQ
jgi:competence protein ComGC